ncbi:MAG: PAS domain S-box protein [Chitinophagaceae bacterium]|nr:MAG: PAS domain S-box protein [Chitinophagaceae bacterium]
MRPIDSTPIANDWYHQVLDKMDQAFCILEVHFGSDGQPYDYTILKTNPVFEAQSGLKDAVGKTGSELVPGLEPHWFTLYGDVARTGKPAKLIEGSEKMGRWFELNAFRIGPPEHRQVAVLFSDITGRVQADARLQENNRLLQTVFDASPVSITVMEPVLDESGNPADYRMLIANEFTKRTSGRNDLDGRLYLETFPHVRQTQIHRELEKTTRTGTPASLELWYEGDGMQHWFAMNIARAGKLLVLTTEDVTARRQALEQVQASESRFQSLVRDSSAAIIVLTGPEMKVEVVNEAYGRLIGRTPDDLLGRNLFDVIPEAAPDYEPILLQVLKTGVPFQLQESAYSVQKGDKRIEGYLHVVYQPYRDAAGNILGVMAMLQDVTEQVRAKQALERSRQHLALLSNTVPAMIFYLDSEQRYQSYNETFMSWFGIGPTEVIGKTVHEFLGDAAYAKIWPHLSVAYAGQQEKYELRAPFRNEDGRWLSITYTPHLDRSGKVIGVIVHATDITQSKQTEIELRDSESRYKALSHSLEEQVAQRTLELQQSNDDLQQFAHVASHDLKEPVRKIKTFVSRLQMEKSPLLDERSMLYLSKVESAANRMLTMIEGVLNYSTLNAARQPMEPVALADVLVSIETDLEVIIQQAGAHVNRGPLPVIEGAPVLLYQLFYNLLNNSLKFTRPGIAPAISIQSEDATEGGVAGVRVILEDNGIGFDNAQAQSIFDTFKRLNSKDAFEGTGLGLALCKKIVSRHGGTITADSPGDSGATFRVWLPYRQATKNI